MRLEVFVGHDARRGLRSGDRRGIGGIYVEIIRETVMRLAPFDLAGGRRASDPRLEVLRDTRRRARAAEARRRGARRGSCRARIDARRSRNAAIASLDLNPIIVE